MNSIATAKTPSKDLLSALNGDRPLRILLPSYRSHPHTGGQGIYMRLVSKAIADMGHEVDVISGPPYPRLDPRVGLIKLPSLDMYARDNPLTCLNREIMGNRIDLFEWWSHNWGGFPEPYTFGERLKRYMKTRIPDYDIMHDNQTLCYGMLEVRNMGLPVVGTVHHPITMDRRIEISHARSPALKLLKWRWYSFLSMQIRVARQLDPLIVVSDSTKRDVHRDFGVPLERMRRIHHGINHEAFSPMPEVKRRNNRLMATASADVPLKGLIYLIRAYHRLLQDFPDLELLVVGDLREGPTMRELEKRGIRDRVTFVSGLDEEDIRKLYAEATMAVSPSVYEGFGFPAGEALSCGVPLVSTDGGSLPEIVGDAGIVVPHSNPEALAGAVADLLNNPGKRDELSLRGRKRILENFTWSRCAGEVVDMYRATMAKNANMKPSHANRST